MKLFRQTPDKSLDRKYLRVCAVYRLMERRGLRKDRAVELLNDRRVSSAKALVEQWLAYPLSPKGRANRAAWRALSEAA